MVARLVGYGPVRQKTGGKSQAFGLFYVCGAWGGELPVLHHFEEFEQSALRAVQDRNVR
jgi:hypothetical protein